MEWIILQGFFTFMFYENLNLYLLLNLLSSKTLLILSFQGDWPLYSWLPCWVCCVEHHCNLPFSRKPAVCSLKPARTIQDFSIPCTVSFLPVADYQYSLSLWQVRYLCIYVNCIIWVHFILQVFSVIIHFFALWHFSSLGCNVLLDIA